MKQHAIQIAKPVNRMDMPIWNKYINQMCEWCNVFVATNWEYRDGIFFFDFENDKTAFMRHFKIKVIEPHWWHTDA